MRRYALLALLAIAAPAAIVAVLGWVSLRQWQASSELLFREQARDVAAMAAEKVEMMLRHAEDALLMPLRAALAAPGPLAPRLDALVAEAPLVRRLYVLDRHGRVVYPPQADPDIAAALVAGTGPDLWERGGRRDLVVVGEVWVATAIAGRDGALLLVACDRDRETLRRDVLEATLAPLEGPTIIAVLDHEGRTVYTRAPLGEARPLLAVAFRDGLPRWRLAVYEPPGASPRQAVRRQIMLFTTAFGVLLAIIVAGCVVTWRLTRRETEMARLKSDFVANVSHDLKTPLSVIRMFGETLEMGRVADEARRQEYYRVITREGERLSRLIDNVLDFSRIESGRRRYDVVPTAVEPVIRETLEAFAYPLEQQGFKVEVSVAPDLGPVPMDADAIGQALANLVDNAIKYSADDKALAIDARVADGRLALSVADRGIGVPPEEQRRIFEKFYRAGRSDTQGRRGSGVGLALVRHVAVAHGGTVTVESEPGAG
ncbi:MAG: sensor histidine kinase, partial [Candidatus Rokuibacteriota bacterium]